MKTIFVSIILLFIYFEAIGQSQETYPLQRGDRFAYVTKVTEIVKHDIPYNSLTFCGRSGTLKSRAFCQWSLPESVIPDGSNVLSGRIIIRYINPHSLDLVAHLFSVRTDLNTATGQELWDRTDFFSGNDEYLIMGFLQSSDGTLDIPFDSSSPFAEAIEEALSDDFFNLGIVSSNEILHEYYYDFPNSEVKLEIVFERPSVSVTVDQKRSDGITSIGSVGHWEGGPNFIFYSVPHTFTFYAGTNEVLKGSQNVVQGPTEKYRDWETYDDVTNHHVFPISITMNTLKSEFKYTYGNIVIKTNLISGGSGGTIKFKDPWFIDYADPLYGNNLRNRGMKDNGPDKLDFYDRGSPFYPDLTSPYNGYTYKGVFLNQNPNPGNPNVPYYTVGASSQQNILLNGQNITFYFQNWSGDPNKVAFQYPNQTETAVVFKASDANAQANYKGTQISSDAVAFSNNSQRRLIETKTGASTIWQHKVYTDINHVWIEHSSDGGLTWVPGNNNQPLDTGAEAKNPSIAYDYDNGNNFNYIGVVWQQKYNSKYKIMGKIFNQPADFYNVPFPDNEVALLYNELSESYSINANPNLCLAGGWAGPYLFTIEKKATSGEYPAGINWFVGHVQGGGGQYNDYFNIPTDHGVITGTNSSTTRAQLYVDEYGGETIGANFIYQQGTYSGGIYSGSLYFNYMGSNWVLYEYNDGLISYPSANISPSIVTLPDLLYAACWIEYETLTYYLYGGTVLNYYDSGVRASSINRGGDTKSGFVAWSRQNASGTWYN
jgi:hypothetical protein